MLEFSTDASPDSQTLTRYLRVGVGYCLVWLITWYSARLLGELGGASLWFLPAGLRFTVIFFLGWRGLLLELVTVWAVSTFDFLAIGNTFPPLLSAQMAWLNFQWLSPVLGYAMVLLPLRKQMRSWWRFKRPLHSSLFLAYAVLASAFAAMGGAYGLVRIGSIEAAQLGPVWVSWLVGDFVGIVTLAPLLLTLVCPRLTRYLQGKPVSRPPHQVSDFLHFAVPTVLVVVLSLLLVFGLPQMLSMRADEPFFSLLLLLPLAGLALRFGLHSALLAVFLFDSGLVILLAVTKQGDFALRYQLVMMAIALVGLWLGGAVDARQRLFRRYRDFAYVSNDLLWEADAHGRVVSISGRLAKHLALPEPQHWRELLAHGEPEQLADLERRWLRQQPFRHLEIALHTPDRATRWIQLNGQPSRNDAGELIGYSGSAVDVSKARRARALLRTFNQQLQSQVALRTRELEASQRHLQVMLAAAPVGVMELDAQDRCCFVNDNACALIGRVPGEAMGRSFLDFVHPDDRAQVQTAWNAFQDTEGVHSLEFRLDPTQRWCSLSWIRLNPIDAEVPGAILVLSDSTVRRQQAELLWSLAHHDALTQLPNRSLFKDRCAQALNLAKRNQTGVAVMWVDLDGFKAVNDTLGHAAGDQLLVQVAQRLRARARDSDTVARMGGDEFALVMSGVTDLEQSEQLAQGIVQSLSRPFDLPHGPATVSASVGVALYPTDATTVDNLIRCADLAMYSAKRSGKNKEQSWRSTGLAPLE